MGTVSYTRKCIQLSIVTGNNSLLPLLRVKVNALDTQVHTMNMNMKAISALNLGQTPVNASDCPVYTATKEAFTEGSSLREILERYSLATTRVGPVVDVNQNKVARYCVNVTLGSLCRKLVDAVKSDGSTLDP